MGKDGQKTQSFKSALEEIAKIISKLEGDECELEDMAKFYEEGMRLLKFCENKINETKLKIEEINSEQYINKQKSDDDLFFKNSEEQE